MMMRSTTPPAPQTLLRAFRRGAAIAGLALASIAAVPLSAEASTAAQCTASSTGVLMVDVSYDGNFYSRDGDIWVGSMDPWEIADYNTSSDSVDVLFFFYTDGVLTVDQYDYGYAAGSSLFVSFKKGELHYVGANADLQRALLPMPLLPGAPEPKGPLPQNEVIIAPKTSCT